MTDEIDRDNERHRREEKERRAKRQKLRDNKSRPGGQSEKERKRREHAQRILGAQHKKKQASSPSSQPFSSSVAAHHSSPHAPSKSAVGGSSVFQSLFVERAEGFFIDLRFRNAPPRPPVGPAFVGLGLEGELDKWTQYKARNAVENAYTWKLHASEPDLAPLAASAMDYEGCYHDPDKKKDKGAGEEGDAPRALPSRGPRLHPDDEALIHWKGPMGDSAAEQLQQKQDHARAAARLAIAQGHGAMPQNGPGGGRNGPAAMVATGAPGSAVRLKKHHLQSRLLDEQLPHFMKKTTYITNDATSVHRFTSLASTQIRRAQDVDRALAETRTRNTETGVIERGFAAAAGEGGRTHPSKPHVTPLWDMPLLPDAETWGSIHTHVVFDHPPKNIGGATSGSQGHSVKDQDYLRVATRLRRAIVADVTKQTQKKRMKCTVWAPTVPDPTSPPAEDASSTPSTSPGCDPYDALQRYDLEVVPLRDAAGPLVHYVWAVDPTRGRVGYHPVGSRVQLSTGRPADAAEIFVTHRLMRAEDRGEWAKRAEAVDVDLEARNAVMQPGRKQEAPHTPDNVSGSDSDAEAEGDAF